MNNRMFLAAVGIACSLVVALAGNVNADAIPYPNAGTPNPATYTFLGTGGSVTAYFASSSAADTDFIGMYVSSSSTSLGTLSSAGLYNLNNQTTSQGTSVNLGLAPVGGLHHFRA